MAIFFHQHREEKNYIFMIQDIVFLEIIFVY